MFNSNLSKTEVELENEKIEQEIKERTIESPTFLPSCWRKLRQKGMSAEALDKDYDLTHIIR